MGIVRRGDGGLAGLDVSDELPSTHVMSLGSWGTVNCNGWLRQDRGAELLIHLVRIDRLFRLLSTGTATVAIVLSDLCLIPPKVFHDV